MSEAKDPLVFHFDMCVLGSFWLVWSVLQWPKSTEIGDGVQVVVGPGMSWNNIELERVTVDRMGEGHSSAAKGVSHLFCLVWSGSACMKSSEQRLCKGPGHGTSDLLGWYRLGN